MGNSGGKCNIFKMFKINDHCNCDEGIIVGKCHESINLVDETLQGRRMGPS